MCFWEKSYGIGRYLLAPFPKPLCGLGKGKNGFSHNDVDFENTCVLGTSVSNDWQWVCSSSTSVLCFRSCSASVTSNVCHFQVFSVFCFPSCSDLVRSSVCVCRGGSPSTEGSPHSWLFLGAQQSRSSPTSEVCFVLKGREGVKNHPFRVTVY